MALQLSLSGFLIAAALEAVLLIFVGRAAGAGLAAVLAILILTALDFFWMRSMAIILGQLLGFLSVTGIWYILILVGVVH